MSTICKFTLVCLYLSSHYRDARIVGIYNRTIYNIIIIIYFDIIIYIL